MAAEKDFAKELNAMINRYIDGGCDPADIADELLRSKFRGRPFQPRNLSGSPSLLPGVKLPLGFYHTHVPAGADLNRGTYTAGACPNQTCSAEGEF